MSENNPTQLSPDLLNDFYAECEEHLESIRQCLATLEGDQEELDPRIERLFRNFHSLKGIVSMAGIASAERVAHRTEDYLREVSRDSLLLTPQGLDAMGSAAQLIEQIVESFREGRDSPDPTAVLALVEEVLPREGEAGGPEVRQATPKPSGEELLERKMEEAAQKGFAVWKCSFVPSPALNERGVNVNAIRQRLAQAGEIFQASPLVQGGTVAFEFIVAAAEPLSERAGWDTDGVVLEQIREAAPGSPRAVAPLQVPSAAGPLAGPSQVVRVELSRLNELMRIAGELVIQRARLEEQLVRMSAVSGVDTRGLHEVNLGFARHFRELRETVIRLRMVPISEIFDRLPFVVRDLTRGSLKQVRLDVQGHQTQMDKFVVERLKEPLLHLVRNAVSHGIEDARERIAAGKEAEGLIRLSATTSGDIVSIRMEDDGRGMDHEMILRRVRELGMVVPAVLDDAAILDFICRPGFSTRDEADRAAGRGVGMGVVSSTLRELGGTLFLETRPGRGTCFAMRLPLTLLITEALIVSTADQKYAIPQNSVEEVLQIDEASVRQIERAEMFSLRGAALPLIRLRSIFGLPEVRQASASVLVSQTARGPVGLVVDRILGQRQVVVRALRDPLVHVRGVMGATELGDGKPLLILDPAALAQGSQNQDGSKQEMKPGGSVRLQP